MNLHEQIHRIKNIMGINEGLHDTSWENNGNKVTLIDLLDATNDIPVEDINIEELKPHLLNWGGDEEEMKKVDNADLSYPILIFVDDNEKFISIIDGHHRAQKAIKNNLPTIKGKRIKISSLPDNMKKVFSHLNPRVYDYDPNRNTVPMEERYLFDVTKLINAGAAFITPAIDGDPESPTYKEWLDSPSVHFITLKNVTDSSEDGWIHKAITKKADPSAFHRKDFVYDIYDGKYNQILWSLEKLGIDPSNMIFPE